MTSATYFCGNFPMQTTAAPAKVATGTSAKTMLQVLTASSKPIYVKKWYVSFDAAAAATPVVCELIDSGTIAATVTAHIAAGVQPYGPDQTASLVTLSTSGTGYTSSAEGTITTTRTGDIHQVDPALDWEYEWALGEYFFVPATHVLRVRVTAAATVNCLCWVMWEE
jgi:hypothetical protein